MTTKRIVFPFGIHPRRVRNTTRDRLREQHQPDSAFQLWLEAFPTCLRSAGFGFKCWRFGDAFLLRGNDAGIDRMLDRSPFAGRKVAS